MKHLKFLLFPALATLLFACKNDNFEDMHPEIFCTMPDTATFTNTVYPIFQLSCGTNDNSCHSPNSQQDNLNDYSTTIDMVNNNVLLPSINHTSSHPMPKDKPKLDDCTIRKITLWVNQGTLQ